MAIGGDVGHANHFVIQRLQHASRIPIRAERSGYPPIGIVIAIPIDLSVTVAGAAAVEINAEADQNRPIEIRG